MVAAQNYLQQTVADTRTTPPHVVQFESELFPHRILKDQPCSGLVARQARQTHRRSLLRCFRSGKVSLCIETKVPDFNYSISRVRGMRHTSTALNFYGASKKTLHKPRVTFGNMLLKISYSLDYYLQLLC
jgi:hypothetical protein